MKNAIKLILTGDAFYAIGCIYYFEETIRDILAFIGPNYLM